MCPFGEYVIFTSAPPSTGVTVTTMFKGPQTELNILSLELTESIAPNIMKGMPTIAPIMVMQRKTPISESVTPIMIRSHGNLSQPTNVTVLADWVCTCQFSVVKS